MSHDHIHSFLCEGLDPALPLFITASTHDKLDESDAEFVDVIHSNALVQGKIERCGHADFYMNGGIIQPGCFQSDASAFSLYFFYVKQFSVNNSPIRFPQTLLRAVTTVLPIISANR